MATEPARRLFTIDVYHRMADAGVLTEDDRVELLDGEIVQMTPIGSRHASVVDWLSRLLVERLGRRAHVRIQNPVILNDLSEPEPDVAVCELRDDRYVHAHPRPADILLLIEVPQTSGRYDRERKIPAYAAAGVPEVWLVDLERNTIEVYREPSQDGYTEVRSFGRADAVSPSRFPDCMIAVDEILG